MSAAGRLLVFGHRGQVATSYGIVRTDWRASLASVLQELKEGSVS